MRINRFLKETIGSYIFSIDSYRGFNKLDKSGRIELDGNVYFEKRKRERTNLIN